METEVVTPNSELSVNNGVKTFFLSICRMHKQNNFNRFESFKVHNKVDDLIREERHEQVSGNKIIQIVNKDHTEEINTISGKIGELSDMNSKLMKQINYLANENSELKGQMHKFENVPVVKLVSKKEGKSPLIITKKEYEHIKELKEKIDVLEQKYDVLSKEEDYDDKLLLNHKERIEILKEKLRVATTGEKGNNA